jgi:hypothetical protein
MEQRSWLSTFESCRGLEIYCSAVPYSDGPSFLCLCKHNYSSIYFNIHVLCLLYSKYRGIFLHGGWWRIPPYTPYILMTRCLIMHRSALSLAFLRAASAVGLLAHKTKLVCHVCTLMSAEWIRRVVRACRPELCIHSFIPIATQRWKHIKFLSFIVKEEFISYNLTLLYFSPLSKQTP